MDNLLPPIGIFNSVQDWISAKDGVNSYGADIKEIYDKVLVSSIKRRPRCPPSWYPNELTGGYVAVIPNGRVWGSNGAIITPDNHLIWDLSFEGVNITPDNHSIFKEKALPSVSYFKNVAVLTHIYSMNYFHWMYEMIPRIHLLQQSGLNVDQFIVNIDPEHSEHPHQSETLNQLGLKNEDLLITNSNFHVQAESLILPSQPRFPTKWAYDFLRKTFLKDTALKPFNKKRIFISRKLYRKIINEDEVMEVLSKYGFIKLDLESLSVTEQAELFSSAEVIIAAHGAALTNITFCQPGTRIIEIFPPTFIMHFFWAVSLIGKLDYNYYIGQLDDHDSLNLNRWTGGDNIIINIPEFRTYLKKMRLHLKKR